MEAEYPEDFRLVFRHYPLIGTPERPFHDKAALSMVAAEAAGRQDKFWEMHDLLMGKQSEWVNQSPEQFKTWLAEAAEDLSLDVDQFNTDLDSAELNQQAVKAWEEASQIGIPGTPFLLVNGTPWPNSVPMDAGGLRTIIELTRLEKRQFSQCPDIELDQSKQYLATLHTSRGDIVIELLDNYAPMAVKSFIFLAQEGWFDGVMFHRVLPDFVAQAGDPTGTGYGGPGYAFDNEISPDLKYDKEGVVGMANAGPGSNGSQFFITFKPTPDLDGGYTIFGRVVSGMDVARRLTPRNPQAGGELPPGDVIESVTIEVK